MKTSKKNAVNFFKKYLLLIAIVICGVSGRADTNLGNGFLSLVSGDNACVRQYSQNSNVNWWNIQAGKTYSLTLSNINDCANGGTANTITVSIVDINLNKTCYIATKISTGTYRFVYTASNCGVVNIWYCVTNCAPNSGPSGFVARCTPGPGSGQAAELRTSLFNSQCVWQSDVSSNCCVLLTPTVTASGPLTICSGKSVVLTASGASTYSWNTGATTSTINVGTAGSFWVVASASNACSSANSNTVSTTVNPSPTITI